VLVTLRVGLPLESAWLLALLALLLVGLQLVVSEH
jgi:hypothetical protein